MSDRIEVHSGPDSHGRYVHTRYWMAEYHPGHPDGEYRLTERGQVFHSVLPTPTPEDDHEYDEGWDGIEMGVSP